MLTGKTALAFWSRFAAAPPGWLASPPGLQLVNRAVEMVREREGLLEAKALRHLADVAVALDSLEV